MTPRNRWVITLFQLILGLVFLYFLINWSHVGAKQIIDKLSGISVPYFILGISCFFGVMLLGGLRYYLFFQNKIPLLYFLGVNLVQNALVTFIPWRIGEVSFPLLLKKDHDIPLVSSFSILVLVRVMDLVIILTIGLLGSKYLYLDLTWLYVAFILGMFILFAVLLFIKLRGLNSRIVDIVKSTIKPLANVYQGLLFILLSVGIFFLSTLQTKLILQAISLEISITKVTLLNAVTLVAAVLPVHPPGGWGTIDSVQIVLLSQLGYSVQNSTSTILAAHTLYTLIIFLGGIFGWMIRKVDHQMELGGSIEL